MSEIKWPEDWDPKEGWADLNGGSVDCATDKRKWKTLDTMLWESGQGHVSTRMERLGGPVQRAARGWTMEKAEARILEHAAIHKWRPAQNQGREWSSLDKWLRARKSSLKILCDKLNIPGGRSMERSWGVVRYTPVSSEAVPT